MISVDDARGIVLQHLTPLDPRRFDLADALGCVCAEEVRAREPSPRFDNSSMDGFALRAIDTKGGSRRLRVTSAVFAGDDPSVMVGEGEAARIMTGAPIPAGADSVCLREATLLDPDGTTVVIEREVSVGEAVRRVGEDVSLHQVLVSEGDELGPALLGVLASQGYASVTVHPRPVVGVLSTGNELASTTHSLAPGMIRDTNRPSLLASVRASGFDAIDLGIVGDSPADINETLTRGAASCDAIVSTGGVSVGDADFVKSVLFELCGDQARSMQVAMKPGKPFAFGVTKDSGVPIFGLAGNPVSTLVGFETFVRPALRRLGGHRVLDRLTINMILDCSAPRKPDGRLHLVHAVARVHDDGEVHVERVARHGSHLLHAVALANVLIFLPDGGGAEAGDVVRGMVLEADLLSAL
ncbi:MAG TPA: gephyrin-like molybdotransferase Glp [Acidimicrobiales bacterium]|nr:gephyrin-like molybdotransferase Glp [Acidimicrobiales bacterium]